MDRRDDLTWIALELTRQGEAKIEEGTLAPSLRRDLHVAADFPVFIPSKSYIKKGRRTTIHLMEGYAFVATGLPEVQYFGLEKTAYVEAVMSSHGAHGMRVIHAIPNRDIEKLKRQLREHLAADIEENAWVKVIKGKFKGLEGQVVRLHDEQHAYVSFRLRSLHRVSPIPRVFLQAIEPPPGVVASAG